MTTSSAVLDALRCPICCHIPHGAKYYMCCNGHSLCELCFDNIGQNCPECRVPYSPIPVRNRLAEQIVATDPHLELSCSYAPTGCPFTGNRRLMELHKAWKCRHFMVQCPQPCCKAVVQSPDLDTHLNESHTWIHREHFSEDLSSSFCFYFGGKAKLFQECAWHATAVSSAELQLFVVKRIDGLEKLFQLCVLVNAPPERARGYRVQVAFPNGQRESISCSLPVFSLVESRASIWGTTGCLSISEKDIHRLRSSGDPGEEDRGFMVNLSLSVLRRPERSESSHSLEEPKALITWEEHENAIKELKEQMEMEVKEKVEEQMRQHRSAPAPS